MPSRPKKINKVSSSTGGSLVQEFADFDNEENDLLAEQQTTSKACDDQSKKSKKRKVIDQTPDEMDYSDQEDDMPDKGSELEMSSLLSGFGAEIKNTLNAKRKRIQSFTQAALKASNKKFDEIWQKQQRERVQHEDFSKQVMNVLGQWEIDLQKTREAMEKLESLYHQQSKLFNQQHAAQTQRLKRVVHLHEDYMKNVQELKKNQEEYKQNVFDQLRKETSVLQKKILSDTQAQDFSNVRRSLQTMLAQV